ncbi:MAG: cupin domain-containing protein [Tannerella sp.]|jgi:hypothetical protein|nr:cupin domain-containing protein [Tannerella sp.]
MIPVFEKIVLQEGESFFIGIFQDNLEKSNWHYHNTYEISFITEGTGKRIVGDSIEDFQPGDLVFIGKNLPHVWIADKEHANISSNRTLESVFLQFSSDILYPQLLALPEFKYVDKALTLSERGLQITGDTLNDISRIMLQMPYMKGFERMIHFYAILDIIGKSTHLIHLAGREYMKTRFTPANKRVAQIHEYLMNSYKNEIDLNQLAEITNMTES